jgi:hypothetical protein
VLTRRILPALAVVVALVATASPASAAPQTRTLGRAIEAFARYQPQTTCSPTAKAGTKALRTLVLRAYGGTGDLGIVRNCGIGGRSEHKEGRAWDWKVSVKKKADVRAVNDFLHFALKTDKYGNRAAMARRLGIMYMIWNRRIWSAGTDSWRPYTGSNPHTTHMHISLSWAGALKKTSYWTGKVAGPAAAPKPAVTPTSKPTTKPIAKPAPTQVPKPIPSRVLTRPATLVVPAGRAAGVLSTFRLAAGKSYLLKVTGTYDYGPEGMVADAECSAWADGSWNRHSAWEEDGSWTGKGSHLDLQVAGRSTRWMTRDGSDCDTATHSYFLVLRPGTTGPLAMKVVDDVYDDNSGSLTVTVIPFSGEHRHHRH